MQDGRRAAQHVAGGPHITKLGPQGPLMADLVDRAKWHHQTGNQEVGDGEGQDQIIRHVLQVSLQQYGRYHKNVSCNEISMF